ncbi:MAG: adenylate cyclase, partial [Hyphomicrobiales bacterium]|nr:adenylate cyclase [Hyphomicrobiales bacterium]
RDLDVADMRLKLGDTLHSRRATAYANVLEAFASARYRRLLIDLAGWLSHGDWRAGKNGAFADVAAREMHRWDRRISKAARKLAHLPADKRHKLRIRAKSLAYVGEMAAGVAHRKDHAAYLKALKAFQSALGDLNDVRISAALLKEMAPEISEDAERDATRRNASDAKKLERSALKAMSRFVEAPRPFD